MGFLKYEFYNKLLGNVTLLRLISGVTWTQYIYIYIYMSSLSNYCLAWLSCLLLCLDTG